jgi:DNA-binding winged helix-turn-helix (wHTH) protein
MNLLASEQEAPPARSAGRSPIRPAADESAVDEKDIAMRAYNTNRRTPGRVESASVGTDSERRSASIHLLNSATRTGTHQSAARSTRVPPTFRNEMAELLVDVDGSPVLVRLLVTDVPAEMQSGSVSSDASIHRLLSRALEGAVDRMRESSPRNDDASKQPLAMVELASGEQHLVRQPTSPNETVLRVGPLELDLLDRTAKRGGRPIDLRPREFRLLKYMMQRNDKLLTRATLLKEVWNYKFVPETNLVDVHMGRLRRKVDGPNETPLIRSVRGAGFVLSAAPCPHDSLPRAAERSANPPRAFFQHAQHAT